MNLATTEMAAPAQQSRFPKILVVDDEASYREALETGLAHEGFEVFLAANAQEAMALFLEHEPDLVLLDVMLPDKSGIEICREIRLTSNVPIIMVSARTSEVDIVVGLEIGASDYVTKPYRFRELIARMRAVLRRGNPSVSDDDVIVVGPIRLDASRRDVMVRGDHVDLSRKEFDLLWLLMTHAGAVVTRDACIDAIWWGQDLIDSRTLDTHIKRLRRKIEIDPALPRHLLTIRGVGFRFDA
jgi:two-component system, OmpR family, response regulator RegX3